MPRRWQQSEIPVTAMPAPPALPEPTSTLGGRSWWPTTESTYSSRKVQGRNHCDVCVLIVHSGQWTGPPRTGRHVRRSLPGQTMKDPRVLVLCDDHKRMFVDRDNAVRTKAGKDPIAGGGA